MKTFAIVGVSLAAGLAHAQPASAPPIRPAPTSVLVGANTVFGPIVANLEEAVAFYRGALGLQVRTSAPDYGNVPSDLIELLGLPEDTQWRYAFLVTPTLGIQFELVEVKGARSFEPADIADPGATWMQLRIADVDAAVAEVTKAGGTLITTGGRALDLRTGSARLKLGVVRDPDGLFLVLIETPPAP